MCIDWGERERRRVCGGWVMTNLADGGGGDVGGGGIWLTS